MSFKKCETNQNKTRYPGRKRKIIATIALSLSLLFGKTRLSSSQSSSPNFDNKIVQEKIIDDQEFYSLEDNDQQVILTKIGDSRPSVPTSPGRGQPSNFPTPPAGGRPSRNVPGVNSYPVAAKIVDFDFVAERVGSGETIFIDHKGMIDFGSLSDKGIDISGFPSHESVAFNMGKDSVDQKGKFIDMDQGPISIEAVVHLYNFENIRNRTEIPILMQAVLNGAEQAGYMDGIIFLNYEQ